VTDGRTDERTNRQNYYSQDRASIAASRGNETLKFFKIILFNMKPRLNTAHPVYTDTSCHCDPASFCRALHGGVKRNFGDCESTAIWCNYTRVVQGLGQHAGWVGSSCIGLGRVEIHRRLMGWVGSWVSVGRLQKNKAFYLLSIWSVPEPCLSVMCISVTLLDALACTWFLHLHSFKSLM